jgi:hypothetical protein
MPSCPQCHAPLPADAPEGLCPACLLKRGLEANTWAGETQPTDPAAAAAPRERREKWTPPTLEELAPFFPDLDLLEFLGRGGMGAVYKARQKSLDRIVALKILPPAIGQDAAGGEFAARFTYEAQAMARLNHPHIVTIYEFGQRQAPGLQGDKARASASPLNASVPQSLGASSLYFFLMEFVDGLTLRHLINARTLRPQDALAIVPQICDALQYAHDRGIIHRDIKPENILLTRDGQIKIADFGLAKLIGSAAPDAGAPNSPAVTGVAGTPAYMAPEQARTPAAVDHRADIYALGVVFYQLLTGELPKDGGMFVPPSKKVHIDIRLDEIVLRALEKSPDLRYQNATQLKTEVETVISTPPAVPAPPPPVAAVDKPVLPRPRLSKLAVVGALWSGLFFVALLVLVMVKLRPHIAPAWSGGEVEWYPFKLALLSLCAIGLSAVVGTTICGLVSTLRIRRSHGTLTGLPLALYDLLVFPLLTLDTIIWLVLYAIMSYIVTFQNVRALFGQGPEIFNYVVFVWPGTLILSALLDTLIVWIAWTVARPPSSPASPKVPPHKPLPPAPGATVAAASPPAAASRSKYRTPIAVALFHVLLFILALIFFAYVVPYYRSRFATLSMHLPLATQWTLGTSYFIQRWACVFILPLLAVDSALCFLAYHLGGRRLLHVYSFLLLVFLGIGVLASAFALRLPDSYGTSARPAESLPSRTFRPIREYTITREKADAQGLVFFSLADARALTPPFPVKFTSTVWVTVNNVRPVEGYSFIEITPELKQWATANHVDLVVHFDEKQWDWQALETKIRDRTSAKTLSFDTTTPLQVADFLAAPRRNWSDVEVDEYQDHAYVPHVATWFSYTAPPYDAAFLNRDGAIGILRMTPDPNANAIDVRVKTVDQ